MSDVFTPNYNKHYKFYGAENGLFKIDNLIVECREDEDDGYRSSCEDLYLISSPEDLKELRPIFFRTSIDIVKFEEIDEPRCAGWRLASVEDGHCWLEMGTDNSDDYYPNYVFSYTPRKL